MVLQTHRARRVPHSLRSKGWGTCQIATIAASLYVALGITPSIAAEWPNWRGPNHDGISHETGLQTKWTSPLPMVWDREIGSAFSSFACVNGRVYTCGTADMMQVLYCLDANTGDVIWQTPFESAYRERQGGDGTRATPAVHDGKVYILGAQGKVACFDADTGSPVWDAQLSNPPTWGYSGSVLIEGDLAVVSGGGASGALVAFDRRTGKQVWKTGNDPVGYATPYPFTFEGKRYIVGFLGDRAVIVEAATGRQVWQMDWKTSYDVNAASPIFHDGYLFLSSGYRHGCILLKLSSDGDKLQTTEVWQSTALRNKFQSCVLHEGNLYSGDEQGLKCVELLTGAEKWTERGYKHSTVVLAEGNLFVLTQDGTLLIAPASPDKFEPTTTAEILTGRCWTVPTLYQGRIYARNLERVVCFNLKP